MAAHHVRLSQAIDSFMDTVGRKRTENTTRNYRNVLRMLLASVGDIELRHITETHVETFFYGPTGVMADHVTSRGYEAGSVTPSTHNAYRRLIVSFFRYCIRKGWMKQDVMAEVDPAKVDRDVPRLRLNGVQLNQMLDLAVNPRDRAYIATGPNTLKRASELVAIKIEDVDLASGRLRIYNKKSRRWDAYPITKDLDRELRRWITRYAIELGHPLKPEYYLFPAIRRGFGPRVWQPEVRLCRAENIIQRVLVQMGYEEELRGTGTHTIRRSVARAQFDRLADMGGYANAMRVVGAMLDHKSQATTEIYLGLDEDRTRRDDLMLGQPFISALLPDEENVIPLKAASSQPS